MKFLLSSTKSKEPNYTTGYWTWKKEHGSAWCVLVSCQMFWYGSYFTVEVYTKARLQMHIWSSYARDLFWRKKKNERKNTYEQINLELKQHFLRNFLLLPSGICLQYFLYIHMCMNMSTSDRQYFESSVFICKVNLVFVLPS